MAVLGSPDDLDEVELAVVAHRVGGRWRLDDLPDRALADVDALGRELAAYAASAVALLSVGEDFALLARPGQPLRLLLSDQTAALEWDLARSATDRLGLEVGEDDDPVSAGALDLLSDLGISADDLAALVDDEPHPDDLLVALADVLGFGDELEDLLDADEEEDATDEDAADGDPDEDADDDLDEDDALDLLDDDGYDDEVEDDEPGEDDEEDEAEDDGDDEEE